MKKKVLLYTLLIIFSFSFSSCFRPFRSFERVQHPSSPDYTQEKYWAALPTVKDSADAVPYGSGLIDGQSTAKADVFFIYPTIYLSGGNWNADVDNQRVQS